MSAQVRKNWHYQMDEEVRKTTKIHDISPKYVEMERCNRDDYRFRLRGSKGEAMLAQSKSEIAGSARGHSWTNMRIICLGVREFVVLKQLENR